MVSWNAVIMRIHGESERAAVLAVIGVASEMSRTLPDSASGEHGLKVVLHATVSRMARGVPHVG